MFTSPQKKKQKKNVKISPTKNVNILPKMLRASSKKM